MSAPSPEPRRVGDQVLIAISQEDLGLILEALDSHRYWQLSDEQYRNSGYVNEPFSDNSEASEEIALVNDLERRLEAMRRR